MSTATTLETVKEAYCGLVAHYSRTTTTSTVDARHDAVFGLAFYCLAILGELLRIGNAESVTARGAFRTIVESFITLAYLVKKNDAELWKSWRAFGSGQAKLAFLKLDQLSDAPRCVNKETLKALANEDVWQELVEINLGHWEKNDLRKMSEQAGVKDIYDKFYSWTSTYAHGHWCAVRDAVFDTCGNPLHRLHRIPRQEPRALPDVIPDACQVVDKLLGILSDVYPACEYRVSTKQR